MELGKERERVLTFWGAGECVWGRAVASESFAARVTVGKGAPRSNGASVKDDRVQNMVWRASHQQEAEVRQMLRGEPAFLGVFFPLLSHATLESPFYLRCAFSYGGEHLLIAISYPIVGCVTAMIIFVHASQRRASHFFSSFFP